MFPRFSSDNAANVCGRDMEYHCELRTCQKPAVHSDLTNFCFSKFVIQPPLQISVSAVIRIRAEKQMRWIDAPRHIAVMQNKQSIWDWPIVQFPRESVDKCFPTVEAAKATVSPAINKTRPQPTTIRLFNATPKTLQQRHAAGKNLFRHFGLRDSSLCLGQAGRINDPFCPILRPPRFSLN